MAIDKVTSASITTDAVGPTQLNEASNYAFTGTVTGAGATNKPAFRATLSSSATVSNDTFTKAAFNTEVYDTDSAYDNSSNYRFTVPSGEAGKYCFTALLRFYSSSDNASYTVTSFYKNGSTMDVDSYLQLTNNATDSIRQTAIPYVVTLDLAVGDYIEIYGAIKGGGTLYIMGKSYFEGYKLF